MDLDEVAAYSAMADQLIERAHGSGREMLQNLKAAFDSLPIEKRKAALKALREAEPGRQVQAAHNNLTVCDVFWLFPPSLATNCWPF